METMVETRTIVAEAPVADAERFRARCESLIERLGTMDMPIDEKRIREAGGCVGGMLVGIMLGGTLSVPAAEAGAVADLCASLVDVFDDADDRRIIVALRDHARTARDEAVDLDVTFR